MKKLRVSEQTRLKVWALLMPVLMLSVSQLWAVQAERIHLKPVVERLPDLSAVLVEENFRPKGTWYETSVPDTLNLAHRARLSINALTNLRPADYYAVTQSFRLNPLSMGQPNWEIMPKYLRALPLMRGMSGSDQNLEVEVRAMEAMLRRIAVDGQMYCPIAADGPRVDTSHAISNGVALQAVLNWYERDRNRSWLDWASLLGEGLKVNMIDRGGYAYIPTECSLSREGTWSWTLRGDANRPGYLSYTPPGQPTHDSQGQEGAVKFYQSHTICGLVRAYERLDDREALEQAGKLVRFSLKPELWSQDVKDEAVPPSEHGVWTGHFHGNMEAMLGLLSYALATDDQKLRQIVREAYEHGRRHGAIRLGFVPGWIRPMMGRDRKWHLHQAEGCGSANTVMLAVRLTDARLGDYWDDVDSMIRNHYTELQITDLELMKRASGAGQNEKVLKGFMGGFTQAGLTANTHNVIHGCCTANGSRGLYFAWHGITRFDEERELATVNLLLNRAAPWMDIDSYLPYEGKVVLRNKRAKRAYVRMPGWLNRSKVLCHLNGTLIDPVFVGNYAGFEDLKEGDMIRIEFSLSEKTEEYTIHGTTYTVSLRGNTVVQVSPRETDVEQDKNKYPFFVRERFRLTETPMLKVRRFVADEIPPLH